MIPYYKPISDQTMSLSVEQLLAGTVRLTFSSDSGKFGTDEILDEIELPVNELLNILQNRVN